jgi:formate C-acetyltransferase
MFVEERERGIHDVDTHTPSTITAHAPGYLDRDHELIVGLQTRAPLRRAIMPAGGLRMVEAGLNAYGYALDPAVRTIFSTYRKTHNDGVFDAYPADVLAARRSHLITGLPDAYGRGRIIGDYRRVALYGVDRLIADRRVLKAALDDRLSDEDTIRGREELAEQIRALQDLHRMATGYGYDISRPAVTGREAIQWLYFAYLGATKEQNGGSISRQCLELGLVDETQLHVVPLLLGDGISLFGGLGQRIKLERTETTAFASETHLRYRVVK